jgi:hypothetical protein
MHNISVLVLGPLLLACSGCGAAYGPLMEGNMQPAPAVANTFAPEGKPMGGAGLASRGRIAGDNGPAAAAIIRKVIYTGRFTVDVYDMLAVQKAVQEFVESKGGHLQQLSGNTMILRIPSASFREVEPQLRTLGRVDDRLTDIRAQDITEEYYDIELRLKSKKNYLESLYKLLDEAGKLKEKLAVQQEIARVVEEIERLEGRLRLLGNQVSLATVTVTLRLAHSGSKRTFKLPWGWLDTLGVENLVR